MGNGHANITATDLSKLLSTDCAKRRPAEVAVQIIESKCVCLIDNES